MKDLAPDIKRQRLLIEGLYTIDAEKDDVREFLLGLSEHLNLRVYGEPIIHSPEGIGKEDNEGFDAFLPLIDSGISLYVWSNRKFLALVLFTCKEFDIEAAKKFTVDYFKITQLESKEF